MYPASAECRIKRTFHKSSPLFLLITCLLDPDPRYPSLLQRKYKVSSPILQALDNRMSRQGFSKSRRGNDPLLLAGSGTHFLPALRQSRYTNPPHPQHVSRSPCSYKKGGVNEPVIRLRFGLTADTLPQNDEKTKISVAHSRAVPLNQTYRLCIDFHISQISPFVHGYYPFRSSFSTTVHPHFQIRSDVSAPSAFHDRLGFFLGLVLSYLTSTTRFSLPTASEIALSISSENFCLGNKVEVTMT